MNLTGTKKEHSGFILVVVLCMVVMLGILLFGFNYKSRAGLLALDDSRKSRQALNCARAGLAIAIAAVRDTEDIRQKTTLYNLLSGENPISLDEGSCLITVTEESGRLNINLLKDKNGRLNRPLIDRLLRLIDLLNRENFGDFAVSYEIIPSILDWVDGDGEVTVLPFIEHKNTGAESAYYRNLTPPSHCANKPFQTSEQLLSVKGVTHRVFNCLNDFITVRGDGKVNINWASKYVIQTLSEQMDPALAQMIIDRRKIKPFGSIFELREIPGMTDSIYRSIEKAVTVNPENRCYRVKSQGTFDGFDYTIIAVLQRNTQAKNVDVILYKEM
jgi:general secretion pathway protein K